MHLELSNGLQELTTYTNFQTKADRVKDELCRFFWSRRRQARLLAAYGAAAKGNTLLNYAGVTSIQASMVADAAKAKQGKYMPGSHIPIVPPDRLKSLQPDFLLILPWNIATEVKSQNQDFVLSGTRFVTVVLFTD